MTHKNRLPGNKRLVPDLISARLTIAAVEPRGLVELTNRKKGYTGNVELGLPCGTGRKVIKEAPEDCSKGEEHGTGIVCK